MLQVWKLRFATVIPSFAWVISCGAAPSAHSPNQDSTLTSAPTTAANDVEAFGDPLASETQPTDAHQIASCSGADCFECGESTCLQGFYCDEHINACGWLPQCVADRSCECLAKYLRGCTCESRDGRLFVTCAE